MKYRVKTGLLKNLALHDTVECRNGLCECFGSGYTFGKEIIERNPDWFQKLQEVKEGQYWKFGDGQIVRLHKVTTTTAHYKPISEDGENPDWFVGTGYLRQHATLLSDDQVEQALIEEAERRGFVPDQKINQSHIDTPGDGKHRLEQCKEDYGYSSQLDILFASHLNVYNKGEWAETITDEWEVKKSILHTNDGIYTVASDEYSIKKTNGIFDVGFPKEEADAIRDALNDLKD